MNEAFPFPPYLFILIFPAFWCLVLFILSHVSGWSELAKTYSSILPFKGKIHRFQSARINLVNYSASLEITINDSGLCLTPFLPFRPFHKPLLIPWSDLRAEKFKRFLLQGYRLTAKEAPHVTIAISDRLFGRLAPHLTHLLPA